MPIYLIEMWIPREGMERGCLEVVRKILEYIKTHREEFRERKSHRMFRVFVGDKPWFYRCSGIRGS